MVHTLGIHCRLHNQTRSEVVLPLVQKLQGGDKLAKLMEEKVRGGRGRGQEERVVLPCAKHVCAEPGGNLSCQTTSFS